MKKKTITLNKIKIKISSNGKIYQNNIPLKTHQSDGYEKIIINKKFYRVHRVIAHAFLNLKLLSNLIVDHIDGNRLNNNLYNLRVISKQENNFNRKKSNNNKYSQYKGVSWDKNKNLWIAKIGKDRKIINLGRFLYEEEAAYAYNKKAKLFFKDKSNLNKINKQKTRFPKKKKHNKNSKQKNWSRLTLFKDRNVYVNKNGYVKYTNLLTNKTTITKGSKTNSGYYKISLINNKKEENFLIHHLVSIAFLNFKTNRNKDLVIDHINGHRDDNRLKNLRVTNRSLNSCNKIMKNKTSQYKGVSFIKERKKFRAMLRYKGKSYHLGYFKCESQASAAYSQKFQELIKKNNKEYNKKLKNNIPS